MISSRAMSAAPRLLISLTSGRLIAPDPELSWRTRREIKLTRTLGLPTFSSAFLVSSAFKAVSKVNESSEVEYGPRRQKQCQNSTKIGGTAGGAFALQIPASPSIWRELPELRKRHEIAVQNPA